MAWGTARNRRANLYGGFGKRIRGRGYRPHRRRRGR